MTTQEAIKYYGSGVNLAKALGCTPQAIYQWREYPDFKTQCQIQVLTNGKLKATHQIKSTN